MILHTMTKVLFSIFDELSLQSTVHYLHIYKNYESVNDIIMYQSFSLTGYLTSIYTHIHSNRKINMHKQNLKQKISSHFKTFQPVVLVSIPHFHRFTFNTFKAFNYPERIDASREVRIFLLLNIYLTFRIRIILIFQNYIF